jgi:hypothetical protein
MVKKYIDNETKVQRKARKALEKAQKSVETSAILPRESVDENYYVLCLKHGTKYSSEYVNRLYNMVKRHSTIDFEFVCLTDDPRGLNPLIKVKTLPDDLTGWWCKPYMFSNDLGLNGTILYLDLDVVIANNIDKLFTYNQTGWSTIRDFTKVMRPNWNRYNSSVIKFKSGTLNYLWEDFKKDKTNIQRKFFGDQDWLWDRTHQSNPAECFPDDWIMSWKWEVRRSKDLNYKMPKGSRTLKVIENVVPPQGCCVTVFHGDPNPENCKDPWVIDNWK